MRLDARTALYCHEYLHKTYAPNRFDLSLRLGDGDDAIADEFKRLGGVHEDKVLAKIRSGNLNVLQLDLSETYESREIQSAAALLRTDLDILLGASIGANTEVELQKVLSVNKCPGDPNRVSRPDVLVRVGIEDGVPVWAPVDVKSHGAKEKSETQFVDESDLELKPINNPEPIKGRFKESDAYQLAHYMAHLRNIGLAPHDLLAGIIGKDGEKITWSKLDQVKIGRGINAPDVMTLYAEHFLEARNLILDAVKRNEDPNIKVNSIARLLPDEFGCMKCEFKRVCRKEMDEYDGGHGHVTLLATITPDKQKRNFPGIESIQELRKASELNEAGEKAKIRARVWKTGIPELMEPDEDFSIPEFDIEIDIDLENSQAALFEAGIEDVAGKDQVYLYGYGVLDRTFSKNWKDGAFNSFANYGDDAEAEIDVKMKMWNFLKESVTQAESAGKTIGIFHYANHERMWWRKFATRHAAVPGTPTLLEVDNFVEKYFVDLLPIARAVSFKTTGYSIKLLAPLAGFKWEVADPDGAGSMLKYKTAIDMNKSEQERQAARDWLYSYNLDDVRATFAVREYLRSLKFS